MTAELQEILALAIVALVSGVALYRRWRGRRDAGAACHGCAGSSECGSAAPERLSNDPLIRLKRS